MGGVSLPRSLGSLAAAFALVFAAAGAKADVLGLRAVEELALRNRSLLDEYRARTREARALVAKAESGYYPDLALRLDGQLAPGGELFRAADVGGEEFLVRGSRPLGEAGAFTPQPGYGLKLGVEQTLYDFGRTRSAVRAASALRDAGLSGEDAARDALVRDVRDAYLDWATAVELEALAHEAQRDAGTRRERVGILVEQGARPASDLTVAKSDELLAQLEATRAREQRDAAGRRLAHATGLEALPPDATPEPALLAGEIELRGASGAEFAVLERRGTAERESARAHERSDAPQLKASAEAGVRGQEEELFPVYGLMLSLSVPLWDGGTTDAEADAARARASAADARLAELHAEQASRHRDAEARRAAALERLHLAEQFLTLARQRLDEAEARYDAGLAPLQELRDARANQHRARTEFVLARALGAQARLDLASWPGPAR